MSLTLGAMYAGSEIFIVSCDADSTRRRRAAVAKPTERVVEHVSGLTSQWLLSVRFRTLTAALASAASWELFKSTLALPRSTERGTTKRVRSGRKTLPTGFAVHIKRPVDSVLNPGAQSSHACVVVFRKAPFRQTHW